jgi:hypothetical protein
MNTMLDALDLTYRRYVWSQRLLADAVSEAAPLGMDERTVRVTFENALMHRVLHTRDPRPVDLYAGLTAAGLAHAASYAGVAAAMRPRLGALLFAAVQNAPLGWSMAPVDLEVALEPDTLRVGTYTTRRTAWVDRMLAVATGKVGERRALRAVGACALRYASVFADTRHIGPPQSVYDDFHRWGVRHEGFASPFNARLMGRPGAAFYSAFPDTDGVFGSRGSFFDHADPTEPGAWCVDPPFIDETLVRTVDVIRRWRAIDGPTVLLIGPAAFTPDLAWDERVELTAGDHQYEGLEGVRQPLPVDVAIWRFGALEGFDADAVKAGYRA